MSAETSLYAALSGHAGLTALVSDRIWPDVIPEARTLPGVVFARAATEPIVAMDGSVLAEVAELSIGCWATQRQAADACADQVVAAIAAAGFQFIGRGGGFDDKAQLYVTDITVKRFA